MSEGRDPKTDGLVIVDKPAGRTSHDVVGAMRRLAAHPQGRARRHARPDGHRRAGARRRQGHPAAAPPRAGRQGVLGDDPPRAGHRHRRRRGRAGRRQRPPRASPTMRVRAAMRAADRRHRAGAELGLRDQGRRPAVLPAGARRRGRGARGPSGHGVAVRRARRSAATARSARRRRARRMLVRHLRPRAGPRPRRRARGRRTPHRAAPHPRRPVHPRPGPHSGPAGRTRRPGHAAAGRGGAHGDAGTRGRRRRGARTVVRQGARPVRHRRHVRRVGRRRHGCRLALRGRRHRPGRCWCSPQPGKTSVCGTGWTTRERCCPACGCTSWTPSAAASGPTCGGFGRSGPTGRDGR